MRIKERRFSVPNCIFNEQLPGKAFKLLIFLFNQSDFSGGSRPGYQAMQQAIRDDPLERGSSATVRRYLILLEAKGWIFHMKRTNSTMMIWLQIPPRFRQHKGPLGTISVLS